MTAAAPPAEIRPARLGGEPRLRIVKPRPNEPQFDDERVALPDVVAAEPVRHTTGALALAIAVAPTDSGTARLRLVTETPPRPAPLAPAVTPPARAWVGRLVQVVSEVLAGERPLPQLSPHLSSTVYARLDESLCHSPIPPRRLTATPAVRSLRLCEPRPGVAEVAAVVRRGERAAAIALRLEWRAEKWRCVALHVG